MTRCGWSAVAGDDVILQVWPTKTRKVGEYMQDFNEILIDNKSIKELRPFVFLSTKGTFYIRI